MSIDEMRALWKRIMLGCAITEQSNEKHMMIFSPKEIKYLDGLIRSHIKWCEMLLTDERKEK